MTEVCNGALPVFSGRGAGLSRERGHCWQLQRLGRAETVPLLSAGPAAFPP